MYKTRKAQASIMEYILLTLFILMIIFALLFFLSWWQGTQLGMEEHNVKAERTLFLARYVSSSPYFIKENSVFDDSKLTAMQSMGPQICTELEKVFGFDWFIKIRSFDGDEEVLCTWNSYREGGCNSWKFCTKEDQRNISRALPVNIYSKLTGMTGIGIMEVGVYT